MTHLSLLLHGRSLMLKQLGSGFVRKLFQSSLLSHPDIVVPPLAESISDGVIGEKLRKQGDRVAVDDVIAQVETDKVVVDLKTSAAGVLEKVVVRAGDTVKPGQLVAVVSEGSQQSSHASKPAAAAAATSTEQSAGPSIVQAQSSTSTEHHHRTPGIRFPPRRTKEGQRISDLPAEEAVRILSKLSGDHPSAERQMQPPSEPMPSASQPNAQSIPPMTSTAQRVGPSKPQASAAKPVVQSRRLSEHEIELINLGGAAP